MASVKISQLTAAASVSGTQEFEINDSGTSKKVTGSQIKTYVFSGLTVSENDLNTRLMPSGGIIIWSGSSASIPSGWYLCNGANGTPDLRDRFVVGAGTTYAVGATGGQNAITTVPAHDHGVGNLANSSNGAHTHTGTTASVGDHTHSFFRGGLNGSTNQTASVNSGTTAASTTTNAAGGHSHTFTTDSGGAHTHTISGNVASSGNASVDVRPPYYALCYIMKA
ncbi:hypothetical protein UFOVP847_23 [uncultured Caudovirales phage]|uniref:Phage tail collar domain containing protein n=1 Tax=uncultured Caudovirales phage TaxID=2100421 RepID=A0A6J5PA98_9CAUD|nr:hypothetical protein UFOVP847_23 [uncultured Caudovirales phage]